MIAIENPLAYSDDFAGNWDKFPALEGALQSNPAIKQMCVSSNIPGRRPGEFHTR
ncbi:MAG: hypothetical protein WDO15_04205 [Bacteroidota bacterium]